MLTPIVHDNTDILFIPLNPSEESSRLGHYFAANDIFWESLQKAGFFKAGICKSGYINGKNKKKFKILIEDQYADSMIFKSNNRNYKSSLFSVHDLAFDIVNSKSTNVTVTSAHVNYMWELLKKCNPKFAIVISREVKDKLMVPLRDKWNMKFDKDEYTRWSEPRKDFRTIKDTLTDDWGPWGKVIKGLPTFFFCVPFPSTQCGSKEQHSLFWCNIFNHIKLLTTLSEDI